MGISRNLKILEYDTLRGIGRKHSHPKITLEVGCVGTPEEILLKGYPGALLADGYLVESQEVHTVKEVRLQTRDVTPEVKESLRFLSKAWVDVKDHLVSIHITFTLNPELLSATSFYVRWGSYSEHSKSWADVEVKPLEISRREDGTYEICKNIRVDRRGNYGATIYAQAGHNAELIWQGLPGDDARFSIGEDSRSLIERLNVSRQHDLEDIEALLEGRLDSYGDFEEALQLLTRARCRRDLGRVLFKCVQGEPELRSLLSEYYAEAVKRSKQSGGPGASVVQQVLENLGTGEVVLVAPEGPHAMAGGMAQVMNGLLKSLSQQGLPVTFIAPLYEQRDGFKHAAATDVLEQGLQIGYDRLPLKYAGVVEIPFGPTVGHNGRGWVQQPHTVCSDVYTAEYGNIRVLLMRHERYADRLYSTVMPDEALRRAVFISRGSLEIMKNPLFGVHPQIVISNDWITGLVPVLLSQDARYRDHKNFEGCKSVHIIHNCGRDYHGKIPVHYEATDLWPMLELPPESFTGMVDPENQGFLNLTAGAIKFLNGALLAVSRPYAQQLLSWGGGEGLGSVLWERRDRVVGISNAIDQEVLRRAVICIGDRCKEKFGEAPLWQLNGHPLRDATLQEFIDKLPEYKRACKRALQRDQKLIEGDDRVVISMIGRLAEQKGVELLSGWGAGDGVSVIESILYRYPEVQFAIAGPIVKGDRRSEEFGNLLHHLACKHPGRVAAMTDFIAHEYALEVFIASDFSLMPSRFEPGGLTQLESLTCGTPVIARNVGGLTATLKNIDVNWHDGNSFLFDHYNSTALRDTICHALHETRNPDYKRHLNYNAATAEHDWSHRAIQYVTLFQHLLGVLEDEERSEYLDWRQEVLSQITPEINC